MIDIDRIIAARDPAELARIRALNKKARSYPRRDRGRAADSPFVGVDGEGAGIDAAGRQEYRLLRAGEEELFTGAPLATDDCLEFLLEQPAQAILVGFWFTYDATMILRDWPEERLRRLFREDRKAGESAYTYHRGYGVDCVPGRYFRVVRRKGRDVLDFVPGSTRAVHEVRGYFGSSFLKAIAAWDIGSEEERSIIKAGKGRRGHVETIGDEERAYCALECRLLAQLMEKVRAACRETIVETPGGKMDLLPSVWEGPGSIAAKLLKAHGTPRRKDLVRPTTLARMALESYHAGRYEVMTYGRLPAPVHAYDIHSAYPWGMTRLWCPLHGRWRSFSGSPPADAPWYVARCHFRSPADTRIGHLWVRQAGRILYPLHGQGTYHGIEVAAARESGCLISTRAGWWYEQQCDCRPYEWIWPLYRRRQELGGGGAVIKGAINALYGKLCQGSGFAPFQDYLAAGLVTAAVRAKILEACRGREEDVAMIVSDSVLSRVPLQVPLSPHMGDWSHERHPGIFTVQAGVWWPLQGGTPRTKGLAPQVIDAQRDRIEAAWREAEEIDVDVKIPVKLFRGHRDAIARDNLALAGKWEIIEDYPLKFDWRHKRGAAIRKGEIMETLPIIGDSRLVSEPFNPRELTALRQQYRMSEASPDLIVVR